MEKFYGRPQGKGIKLHLGCGDYWGDGYLNLDWGVYGGTDMLLDLRKPLPFQSSVVEEIQAHDFVEHFTPEEIGLMLDDWHRVLIEGGRIFVTVPDIGTIMKEYVEKPTEALQAFYGLGSEHRWGYTKDSIQKLFENHKFSVSVKDSDIQKDQFPRLEVEGHK